MPVAGVRCEFTMLGSTRFEVRHQAAAELRDVRDQAQLPGYELELNE